MFKVVFLIIKKLIAAWFRLKYPQLTVGSVASSGVVNAILDFTAFDTQGIYLLTHNGVFLNEPPYSNVELAVAFLHAHTHCKNLTVGSLASSGVA